MKKTLLSLTILTFFYSCTAQTNSYEDEIKLVQHELNTHYADKESSPLTKEDLKTFKGLAFFKIDKKYSVEAKLELTPNAPIFEMQTTTDRLPLYKKYGIAHFTLDGQKFELSIYQSQGLMSNLEYEDYLFLPFNDLTNGNSSYGGGRFIDLKLPTKGNNKIMIDFNKAYNPYCAYNSRYSCPIPPKENNLKIEIPAGVKAFGKHH